MEHQFSGQKIGYENARVKISVLKAWYRRSDMTQHFMMRVNFASDVMIGLTRFDNMVSIVVSNMENDGVLKGPGEVVDRLPWAKPRLQKS
jgi:hypothetical protein